MTEREFQVNRIIHDASATVIIDDIELVGLDDDEKNDLIIEQAMEQDVWQEYDSDEEYNVQEN